MRLIHIATLSASLAILASSAHSTFGADDCVGCGALPYASAVISGANITMMGSIAFGNGVCEPVDCTSQRSCRATPSLTVTVITGPTSVKNCHRQAASGQTLPLFKSCANVATMILDGAVPSVPITIACGNWGDGSFEVGDAKATFGMICSDCVLVD